MYTKIITEIEQKMQSTLDNKQMSELHQVLISVLSSIGDDSAEEETERALLEAFLAAKKVEGCSDKSLRYYYSTIDNMLTNVGKTAKHITTDDLRQYLDAYQKSSNASKVTIDNIRRILSSFFSWLEEENHILKSPVRRIHKVKTGKTVKETYTDEALEIMRDSCETDRDLAMIDLLASTGMRVGEMVKLNRADIDFQERECIVFGKGDKERRVYFDARTKIHLMRYLESRNDSNPASYEICRQDPGNDKKSCLQYPGAPCTVAISEP